MTPNLSRLHDLDAMIAAHALDAMLAAGSQPDRALSPDGVPEPAYDDVELERRTQAYRRR